MEAAIRGRAGHSNDTNMTDQRFAEIEAFLSNVDERDALKMAEVLTELLPLIKLGRMAVVWTQALEAFDGANDAATDPVMFLRLRDVKDFECGQLINAAYAYYHGEPDDNAQHDDLESSQRPDSSKAEYDRHEPMRSVDHPVLPVQSSDVQPPL